MSAWTEDLEPAVEPGDKVLIEPRGEGGVVQFVDVIPPIDTQTFELSDGQVLNDVEIRPLYVRENVLGQFRFFDIDGSPQIPDGVEIDVQQGGEEQRRFTTKNNRGRYTTEISSYGEDAQLTELWQWGDTDLFFTIKNDSGAAVEFDIRYVGFQYEIVGSTPRPEAADLVVPVERIKLGR